MWRTVNEKDDALGFASILRLGHVSVQTANGFDATDWGTLMHFARKAAGAHSDASRHDDLFTMIDILRLLVKESKTREENEFITAGHLSQGICQMALTSLQLRV